MSAVIKLRCKECGYEIFVKSIARLDRVTMIQVLSCDDAKGDPLIVCRRCQKERGKEVKMYPQP